MEEDKKIVASETVTYVFGSANDQDMIKDTAPTRGLLWQVVPCTCDYSKSLDTINHESSVTLYWKFTRSILLTEIILKR
ncbi:unnamed protein product [Acanthoscelides obtectus]|uniref:Uncharacterized protein n=1 Tax=Acanthoscelides obtectus TaxID=200917 RepID=A0A9P0LY11_ACAOB|nr:unnamed protein product [Acanthoscelides obtectus]CAK1633314.1 hypothetical protein AOBTE_LOCUS8035 [Acanthoscelides obtectus]